MKNRYKNSLLLYPDRKTEYIFLSKRFLFNIIHKITILFLIRKSYDEHDFHMACYIAYHADGNINRNIGKNRKNIIKRAIPFINTL